MRPVFSLLSAAAVGLTLGSAVQAADVPGFNEMDKNSDGALTRSEAAANPKLAARFGEVDGDGDGRLSRAEYLAIMARQDVHGLRESLAEFIDPEGKPPLAQSGQARAAGEQEQAAQSLPPAASERLVRNVQQTLRAKGVDAGPADGIWGPRTSAGVREFQQDQGLEPTGQLNAQTLAALGIADEAASAGESATAR